MVINIKNFFKLFIFIITFQINCQKIFLISIPKCGTHLLAKALEILSKKQLAPELKPTDIINFGISRLANEDYFYRSHIPYFDLLYRQFKKQKFRLFFIYRDPRDQIVSRAFWVQKRQDENQKQSIEELIDFGISDLNRCYYRFLNWKNKKFVCSVKFEDLVGKIGQGSEQKQKKSITKICNSLKIEPTEELIKYCCDNIYGDTFTFREGKIGSWKKYFTQVQKEKFKKVSGRLLIKLGYEENNDW